MVGATDVPMTAPPAIARRLHRQSINRARASRTLDAKARLLQGSAEVRTSVLHARCDHSAARGARVGPRGSRGGVRAGAGGGHRAGPRAPTGDVPPPPRTIRRAVPLRPRPRAGGTD